MATLIEFKAAIRITAEKAVFGPLFLGFPEVANKVLRTVSDFDDERLQYHGQLGTGAGPTFQSEFDAIDLLYTMQPGSKIIQVQVWPESIDRLADANELTTIASINILVHRALFADWDANLYENNEMLDNQVDLLSPSLWEALPELSELTLPPDSASKPVRVGPVISYQVSFQARLTA